MCVPDLNCSIIFEFGSIVHTVTKCNAITMKNLCLWAKLIESWNLETWLGYPCSCGAA